MEFIPTYLYIKQHTITGLLYFGKTIQDPFKYKGSGKRWLNHLKYYGNDVNTLWVKIFYTEKDITTFAKILSYELDIVNSTSWANLKPETGIDKGNRTIRGIPETFSSNEKRSILREVKSYMTKFPNTYSYDELIKIKSDYYIRRKMSRTNRQSKLGLDFSTDSI